MPVPKKDQLLQMGANTTCGSLLYELQLIWDEVGENDEERDKMLLQLEQECLDVYRRKVDQANRSRAQLHQTIADYEAELAGIYSSLGDRPVLNHGNQISGSLKEQLERLVPLLEEMRRRKDERIRQFKDVQMQIQRVSSEISGSIEHVPSVSVDEKDLSLRKLEELQRQLQILQKEKSDRLFNVIEHVNTIHGLCVVLGLDFSGTMRDVHPSLDQSEQAKSVSDETIERLEVTIHALREEKKQRMLRLQDLGTTMLELWNLMDTPPEEQQMFQDVTCNIAASEHEICSPNSLSLGYLEKVEAEVRRLEELKGSKMKELVLKKRVALEEICRKTHLILDNSSALEKAIASMEAGLVDPAEILENIEMEIANAKEEAFSRKEILDRVEKWLAACEEERWLEEYNQDENRYTGGKGAHLVLKRAEKARAMVSKLNGIVESLIHKTEAWEKERGKQFIYDGGRLLAMLEDDDMLRTEKEQERKRIRDQKKIEGQMATAKEALFGTAKPSPAKGTLSTKKIAGQHQQGLRAPSAASRRLSMGGAMLHGGSVDLPPVKPIHGGVSRQPNVLKETKRDRLHTVQPHHDEGFASPYMHSVYPSVGQENEKNFNQVVARQPVSPVPSKTPHLSHSYLVEDKLINGISTVTPSTKSHLLQTPLKRTTITPEEENTPVSNCMQRMQENPATPPSVSMLLATPATQGQPVICHSPGALLPSCLQTTFSAESGNHRDDRARTEISFEEIRAGFVPS